MIVLRVSHTVSRWSYDRNNSYITKGNCIINTKVKNKVQKEGANAPTKENPYGSKQKLKLKIENISKLPL